MIGARPWKGHFTRGWLFCWLLRVGNIFEKLDYQSGWHESGVWRGLSESNGEPPTCDNAPRVSRRVEANLSTLAPKAGSPGIRVSHPHPRPLQGTSRWSGVSLGSW